MKRRRDQEKEERLGGGRRRMREEEEEEEQEQAAEVEGRWDKWSTTTTTTTGFNINASAIFRSGSVLEASWGHRRALLGSISEATTL